MPEPVRPDAALAWLRAARRTGLRSLDVPSSCRHAIAAPRACLGRAGAAPPSVARSHPWPVAAEQAALIGGKPAGGGLSLASD